MFFGQRIFWIYLVCMHLLLALLIYEANLVPRLVSKISGEVVENTHLYDVLLPYHRRADGSVPDGAIVFLGDSIVQALVTSAIADKTVNYGIGADTIGGLNARLPIYQSLEKARAIVLSIGINDLWYRGHDQIVPLYDQLLANLPSNVPVIASALFPMEEGLGYAIGTNARIVRVNQSIAKVAERYPDVTFVNSRALFVDSSDQLQSDYHVGDGLHLNSAGYEVWIKVLRERLSAVTDLELN